MSWLLDTNVVSEVRKPSGDASVKAWFESVDGRDLHVSVLLLGEVRQGIERLRQRDAATARVYEEWLARLRQDFADRIIPVSAAIAEEWGRLNAARPLPAIDGLLAATAIVSGLTFVTRNTKDVAPTGVALLNPFEA